MDSHEHDEAVATPPQPLRDCELCPRLVQFRHDNRQRYASYFNAPVPSFGAVSAPLLVVGLAPGLKGANRTGRPFTGDYAGDLLYATLLEFGFARGIYKASPDDGLDLHECRLTNAVRCVPPENRPNGAEVRTCGQFLRSEVAAMSNLRMIVALGQVAHRAVVTVFGGRQAVFPFSHGGRHRLPNGVMLTDSYHCSRYNTNTGRLTTDMFRDVFRSVRRMIDQGDWAE